MSITVSGLREAKEKLAALGDKVEKKLVRSAMRKAFKQTLSRAKSAAPVKTGLVRRSLRIVGGKGRKGMISLRVVMGLKNYVGKSYYGAFQEEGHFTGKRPAILRGLKGADAKERYHAGSVAAGRKFIPGKHFMLLAYDETKSNVPATFATELWAAIEAELK